MISPDDIVKSSQTNGPLVRFVGRNKVRDGFLNQFVCVLLPILVVIDLIYARMARKSWNDVWFQFFGYGTPPSLPCYLEQPMAVRKLRFVCISDTHMMHEKLTIPKGDVLLHTGDFTNHGSQDEVEAFAVWLAKQPHAIKIVIPGNHDMIMDQEYYESYWSDWSRVKQDAVKALKSLTDIPGCHVLIDKGIHIEGVNIWGSPVSDVVVPCVFSTIIPYVISLAFCQVLCIDYLLYYVIVVSLFYMFVHSGCQDMRRGGLPLTRALRRWKSTGRTRYHRGASRGRSVWTCCVPMFLLWASEIWSLQAHTKAARAC